MVMGGVEATQQTLLEIILMHRQVRKETLYHMGKERNIRDKLARLENNGLIRKIKITELCEKNKRNITLYQITAAGAKTVIKNGDKKLAELDEEDISCCVPVSANARGDKGRILLANTARAEIMAIRAGAQTTITADSDDEEESDNAPLPDAKPTYTARLARKITTTEYSEIVNSWGITKQWQANPFEMVYHDAAEIRKAAAESLAKMYANNAGQTYTSDMGASQTLDYNRARNRGMICSEARSVMVFCTDEFGFRWYNDCADKDSVIYTRYSKFNNPLRDISKTSDNGNCAVMLCQDPDDFLDTYNARYRQILLTRQLGHAGSEKSKARIRERNDIFLSNHVLGYVDRRRVFDHIYAVPEDDFGVDHLRFLMRTVDSRCEEGLIWYLTKHTFSWRNTAAGSNLFPLVIHASAGIVYICALLQTLDIMKMKDVQWYAQNYPDRDEDMRHFFENEKHRFDTAGREDDSDIAHLTEEVLAGDITARYAVVALEWQKPYLEHLGLKIICLDKLGFCNPDGAFSENVEREIRNAGFNI